MAIKKSELYSSIWKLCDGKHTREDIISGILENYESESQRKIEQDVDKFLNDLKNSSLVIFINDSK